MKSAFELAMERLGGSKTYSGEQKQKLAEIDRNFDAKKAEVRIRAEDQLKKLGEDPEGAKEKEVRETMARDIARIEEKREREKEKVRNEKPKG